MIDHKSNSLSKLLKNGTRKIHKKIEKNRVLECLLNGELTKEHYTLYLIMLWYVYDALETALEKLSGHSILQLTYNPSLSRADALLSDISSILQVSEIQWKEDKVYEKILHPMPDKLAKYVENIKTISNSGDPSILLAHSYVRYFGDLNGGQILKHKVKTAYFPDEESEAAPLAFYEFNKQGTTEKATSGDLRIIGRCFKEHLNEAGQKLVDSGKGLKAVVDEAKYVFRLNKGLFDVIQERADLPLEI